MNIIVSAETLVTTITLLLIVGQLFEVNQWKFVLELKWFRENIAANNIVAMQKRKILFQ